MPLPTRIKLPDTLLDEYGEYKRITEKFNRTTTGQATFTSTTSGNSYDTTGTAYDNQGEQGLALLLFNDAPSSLKTYIFSDDIYDQTKDAIEQALNTVTPTSGASNTVLVTLPSDYDSFLLETPVTITGGNITINGTNLFSDYAQTENTTELEAGVYRIVKVGSAFFLALSSSGGNIAWGPQQYFETDPINTLLHFDGVDTSTSIIDVSGRIWTANGDAQLDTAQQKFGTASLLLDGTSDYVDTPNSDYFDIQDENFTIDLQIKRTGTSNERLFGKMGTTFLASEISFGATIDGNKVRIYLSDGTSLTSVVGSILINDTNWHHIEITRNGNDLLLFIDGTLDDTFNVTGVVVQDTPYKFAIGRIGEYDSALFNGHIDEFRIEKGVVRHTTNFTPPTQAYNIPDYVPNSILKTDKDKDVTVKVGEIVNGEFGEVASVPENSNALTKVLLHFDGADGSTTFTDESGKVWTPNGDAQLDTAFKKFGTASGLFDGLNDWIRTPDNEDFTLGSEDFTIDVFVRTTQSAFQYICGQINNTFTTTTESINMRMNSNGTVQFRCRDSSFSIYSTDSTATINDGNFHHIKIVREGFTITLYIDDNNEGTINIGSNAINDSNELFGIGCIGAYASQPWNGHIDEFRLIKGNAVTDDMPVTQEFGFPQIFPPITKATQASDLVATVAGTLEMSNPSQGDVFLGHISKVNQWLPSMEGARPSAIENVQSGVITFTSGVGTINEDISSVDMTRSLLTIDHVSGRDGGGNGSNFSTIDFTDSDTLEFIRSRTNGTFDFHYTVEQFTSAKSKQTGIVTGSSLQTITIPISNINKSKSIIRASYRTPTTVDSLEVADYWYEILDDDNIRVKFGFQGGTMIWQVLEGN